MTNPTVQTVLERVERLEKNNRRLRLGGVLAAIVAAAVSLMAQGRPAIHVLEASQFLLKDDSGRVRARLYMDQKGASLSLYDESNVQRIKLMQTEEAAGLILYNDPQEKYGGAQLLLTADGPNLVLSSVKLKNSVVLTADQFGPALDISDGKGYGAILGVADAITPKTGDKHKTSAASLQLLGKDRQVIWSAP